MATKKEYTEKSFSGALEFLKGLADGTVQEEVAVSRKDVLRTEENGWIVDTCMAFDSHKWETGVRPAPEESFSITEQYANRCEAEKGHEKWVTLMRENPKCELPNIIVWETIY